MKNCPSCESDQFKKATLVYDENHRDAKSALAIKCAPPKLKEPSPFGNLPMWQVLFIFIPPMIGFASARSLAEASYIWVIWGCVGFAYLTWKSWKPFKEHQAKKTTALAEYEKCFMCLRCGTLFHPFE